MHISRSYLTTLLSTLALVAGIGDRALAVTATCGPEPLLNTQNVLCANGTCTGLKVTLTTALEVTAGGCEFDLGGRDFAVEKSFDMTGQGFIKVTNAKDVTITGAGRLKARGDFHTPNGFIIQGGLISLVAAGKVTAGGTGSLDVSGDGGGTILIQAGGDIEFLSGDPVVRGNGISSFADLGDRYTDGGEITAVSLGGFIIVDGDFSLTGQNGGTGGTVDLQAAKNVDVRKPIIISGGGGGGGEMLLTSGDDILITRTIDADSKVGGGDGGNLSFAAGEDSIGGTKPGGAILIDGAGTISILLRGSATDTFGGYGGNFDATSLGLMKLDDVIVRADAATNFDGDGGYVQLDSSDLHFYRVGPLDGDLQLLGGLMSMTSGNAGGTGGSLDLTAGNDLTITTDVKANGFDGGGDIIGTAGRAVTLSGAIESNGGSANGTGDGGYVDFEAGLGTDEGASGNISVTKDVLAFGGAASGSGQSITLAGCGLNVAPSIKIDGHAGVGANNVNGGSDIELISRRPMNLGKDSQYLAPPGGTVTLAHLVGQNPIVGTGVVFDPEPLERLVTVGGPNCPVCGDGVRQTGETCDKSPAADGACCNATCNAFVCVTATPTPTVTATKTPTPTRTATPLATRTATPTATLTPLRTLTPTPTVTVTPLVTVTATPETTLTPTPTVSSTPTSDPTATGGTSTPTPVVTPSATTTAAGGTPATPSPALTPGELGGLADAVAAKSAVKCQAAISKAGVSFLAARLKHLDACTSGILKCIQTKPDDAACVAKANAKCVTVRGAAAAARAKLITAVEAKCFVASDLRGATGLGFADLDGDCTAELGHPAASVSDVAQCIARRFTCRATRLHEVQAPRAGELLRVAGLGPEADGCLVDHGGAGEGVDDEVQGKALQQCATGITKAASGFASKKLASLTKCVDKVFTCIQTKPGDAACLAKADAACAKMAAKVSAERAKLAPAIDKKCGGINFNGNLRPPRGVNLAALVDTLPGADTLDTLTHYQQALRLRHDCATDDLLRTVAPRAVTLLKALAPSLVLPSAGCAAP